MNVNETALTVGHIPSLVAPIMDAVTEISDRVTAVEEGTSRQAGEAAIASIASILRHFQTETVPIASLPHLSAEVAARQALGLPVNLLELV